ncbi:choice-of-anchor M domain-containing protein [Phytohabitans aurantiacus]|jgi:surface-anchored protein|uniref:choice-of-anchor M domain-containing protein n=1 Tax=Phytohabitans aurantiacus TaxID=3016789 RepID=UPI0024908752|nr:choice-of-anchor M domain-containing protein [Phytohabitans aurantiacus]
MRARATLLTAATAVATAATLAWAAPAQAGSLVVLSQGHVDIVDVAYEDGAFEIAVHDETVEPGVERDPDDVLFWAKPESAVTVPDDTRYAFLGSPGASVYVLPEVENETLLFPGLATEELEPGVFAGDTVQIRFKKVIGPDGVSLFTTDPAGNPVVLVDSEDGLPDSITLATGTHMHENWAFEKPGYYLIKVDVTGVLAGTGATVTSEPAWLRFKVGS